MYIYILNIYYNMQQQNQNNMITSIDKIPLKQTGNISDDLTDPMVKDVLTEFEKELSLQEKQQQSKYIINTPPPQQTPQYQYQNQQSMTSSPSPPPIQVAIKPTKCYIDNELITKTFIICIIIAIIINPYIYNTIISKIPENISSILDSYNYMIKIILIFIGIYLMMFYNLI